MTPLATSSKGPIVARPPRRAMRTFGLAFAAVAGWLAVPYGCWELTDFGCADSWPFALHNESGQDVIATPFFVDRTGVARTLVVHGLQRGRFAIDRGERRALDLETGDYSFDGILLAFEDGTRRVLQDDELAGSTEGANVYIGEAAGLALAPPQLVEQMSVPTLYGRRLLNLGSVVLLPSLTVATMAAIVAATVARLRRASGRAPTGRRRGAMRE